MGEYLILYLIFALATAVTAQLTLVMPVIYRIIDEKPFNDIAQSQYLAAGVFFIVSVLVAPLVFVPSIFPKQNEVFKDSLFTVLTED